MKSIAVIILLLMFTMYIVRVAIDMEDDEHDDKHT